MLRHSMVRRWEASSRRSWANPAAGSARTARPISAVRGNANCRMNIERSPLRDETGNRGAYGHGPPGVLRECPAPGSGSAGQLLCKCGPRPTTGTAWSAGQFSRWGPLTGTARLRRANTYLLHAGVAQRRLPRHLARERYVVAALRAACRSETGAPGLRTIRSRGVWLQPAFSCPAGCAGGHAHGRFSR